MKKKYNRIYVEITNLCNFNCYFCKQNTEEPRTLSLENFTEIAKQVKKYSDYIYLHVKGEPLIHPKLIQIISCCHELNLKVVLTTNGAKLANYLNDPVFNEIYKINISLQSIVNLKEIDQANYLETIYNYILNNTSTLKSLRIWNDKSKNEITNIFLREFICNKFNLEESDIIDKQKIYDKTYLSTDDEFVWPALTNEINPIKSTCQGGKNQLAILSNGCVVMCCLDDEGKTTIGNIFENSLDEILENELYKNYITKINNCKYEFEICNRCSYRNRFKKVSN